MTIHRELLAGGVRLTLMVDGVPERSGPVCWTALEALAEMSRWYAGEVGCG